MNVTAFVNKWRKADLTERSASQRHFLDLCALLEHPTPAEADPEGATFTFEKGVRKRGGGDGWQAAMTDEQILGKLLALNLERGAEGAT